MGSAGGDWRTETELTSGRPWRSDRKPKPSASASAAMGWGGMSMSSGMSSNVGVGLVLRGGGLGAGGLAAAAELTRLRGLLRRVAIPLRMAMV